MKALADIDEDSHPVHVIGAGLAGTEAAWRFGDLGIPTILHEMRPSVTTPVHETASFAELVCSNSLKSQDSTTATGQLKRELDRLDSRLLALAHEHAVPGGAALVVDRRAFASAATTALESHSLVEIVREEVTSLPARGHVIVATGPLTSPGFEPALDSLVGSERLSFYDAVAPIIDAHSIDRSIVFAQSRYGKGSGDDYLNCPLDEVEYVRLRDALLRARKATLREFERGELFSACQPLEAIARSGLDAMRFGPLKPVGLLDPKTGLRPWAVVQLRAENRACTAYNLVGFQTNLTFSEQDRLIRLIPGLEGAEILRYGVLHRNTFIDAPRLLGPTLALRSDPRIYFAGQLTGTEGYLEAIATGTLAALNIAASLTDAPPLVLPRETALGSLVHYATDPETRPYQPMHVNWGLVPPLPERMKGKRDRYTAYAERADVACAEALRTRRMPGPPHTPSAEGGSIDAGLR